MAISPLAQTPAVRRRHRRQQVDNGPGYITVASDIIATLSVDPHYSSLLLDDSGAPITSAPIHTAVVRPNFQGVGGTLTADGFTRVITTQGAASTDDSTSIDDAADKKATARRSQSIPVGAVVAVCVLVPVLCATVIAFFCWKRRRSERRLAAAREAKRNRTSSFIGGYGLDKTREGPWEAFAPPLNAPPRRPLHPPTAALAKNPYSEKAGHPLATLPVPPPNYKPKPQSSRGKRHSVKSAVTGKINPSNNFAVGSNDDQDEDEWDDSLDDSRSLHSRHPLSPSSGRVGFNPLPGSFHGLGALTPGGGGFKGESASFLTFRSGDGDAEDSHVGLPFRPDSPLRAGPMVQSTPSPRRAPTQRSQKGGAASNPTSSMPQPPQIKPYGVPVHPQNQAALSSLIQALDTHPPRERSPSVLSDLSFPPSPNGPRALTTPDPVDSPVANPFQDSANSRR